MQHIAIKLFMQRVVTDREQQHAERLLQVGNNSLRKPFRIDAAKQMLSDKLPLFFFFINFYFV